MTLPQSVMDCLTVLEARGFATYAVGGCVRDSQLGKIPGDFDFCTAALPEEMEELFSGRPLVLAGKKHGTVGVVTDCGVVEITTFRTEGAYTDNRHPDYVRFVTDIRQDLARRDFTVNAMAWSPIRGFADPFGGQQDLKDRILRAVGDPETRFREDSLRILRGLRFAVRYHLTIEEKTWNAMVSLAPLMENLARERVYEELCKLLVLVSTQELLTFAPVLACVIEELAPMIGFDQRSPHHRYDLYTHTAHVVGGVPQDLTLRWAALLHDSGKIETFTRDETGRGHFYGHASASARIADRVLLELRAPTALREQAVHLIAQHMTRLEPEKKLLRRRLSRLGWETVEGLLCLQEADMGSKGTGNPEDTACFARIREILQEIRQENACLKVTDLAVNGRDLMNLGLQGREVGTMLEYLLDQVLEETVPNEKYTLLRLASAKAGEEFREDTP